MGYIATGVPRLDFILGGGLPESYVVAVAGPPGTGKTVLIQQIAAHYAGQGGRVLYVTGVSETHVSIVANMQAFTFLDPTLLGDRIKLVNVLPIARRGLSGVTSALVRTIGDEKISLVIFDGFRSLRDVTGDETAVRSFLYDLAATMASIKTTALLVGEESVEKWADSPELLVADGVLNLTAIWTGQRHVRSIEVLKMRGVRAVRGPHALEVTDAGVVVYPRPETVCQTPEPALANERASIGVSQLDRLLHGGLPRGSATLVAGHPATGKTLLGLSFLAAGAEAGEAGVYASTVETPAELLARARRTGSNISRFVDDGLLTLVHFPFAGAEPDRTAWLLWEAAERVSARRVVLDGLRALTTGLGAERLPGYVWALFAQLRARGATVCATVETGGGQPPFYDTPAGTAGLLDNVIHLGVVEEGANVRYRMAVVKMRNSDHDRAVHYYTIGDRGLQLAGA